MNFFIKSSTWVFSLLNSSFFPSFFWIKNPLILSFLKHKVETRQHRDFKHRNSALGFVTSFGSLIFSGKNPGVGLLLFGASPIFVNKNSMQDPGTFVCLFDWPKKWDMFKIWSFRDSYFRWKIKENFFQTILFSLTVIRIDNCSSHQNMKTISLGSDCQNCLAFFECTYVLLIFLFETTVVISDDWQVRQEGCEVLLHLGLIWEQKMRFSEDFEL